MVLTLSLGILLVAGVIAGAAASRIGLPSVTLYIIAGLLIGPAMFNWVPEEHLEKLDPVLKLALALVLLEIGSRFRMSSIRKIVRSAVPLSAGELICTFTLVTLGLVFAGESVQSSLLLGGLALATAPATTIVVLQEFNSEGPVTSYTYLLVALNNLAVIVAFEVLFVLALQFGDGPHASLGEELMWLSGDLVMSTGIGIVAGLVMSFVANRAGEKRRTAAVIAITSLVLGICESRNISYLLAFLAMGMTLANACVLARETIQGLGTVAGLLYVVFFVAAGAELDPQALSAVGTAGIVYVAARCAGKYIGIRTVATLRQEPVAVQRWLGGTLIAQAGAAIGLVQLAAQRHPELGKPLQTIIVGTVVFFEVVGPLLTRLAVVRAGEVPVAHLVRPERPSLLQSARSVVNQIRRSLGKEPWSGKQRGLLTVKDLMRSNARSLANSADFLQVLDFIEHSRHQIYHVTDEAGVLIGEIRYKDMHSVLFDPEIVTLVRAEDLAVSVPALLRPEQSLDEAFRLIEKLTDDVIPVVESETSRTLVGLVERRDVVRYMKTQLKNG